MHQRVGSSGRVIAALPVNENGRGKPGHFGIYHA